MIVNNTNNVNTALDWGIEQFQHWEKFDRFLVKPRGASTIEAPDPVCTVYNKPTERVLFSPTRDANPFFHFFESLWMLAGRNDLAFMMKFNKQMSQYSDDGERLWGAYGWRWRSFFAFDQLKALVELLRSDKDSRRGVVTMWSPAEDVLGNVKRTGVTEGGPSGRDVPCNTHLYFKIRHDALHMTVCNRSNDMIWGAYGANAVHMSFLQEYLAEQMGVAVGVMRQVSDSLHVYLPPHRGGALWEKLRDRYRTDPTEFQEDLYAEIKTTPLGSQHTNWNQDLERFFRFVESPHPMLPEFFVTEFFAGVVAPLWIGWEHRSVEAVDKCTAEDWRKAAREWLLRRRDARDLGISL